MNINSKSKLKLQLILNVFLILLSLFFIINFTLMSLNISEELTANYLIGIFLCSVIIAPILSFLGVLNFCFYDKYKKSFKNQYKKFFIISLVFSIIPLLLTLSFFDSFGS